MRASATLASLLILTCVAGFAQQAPAAEGGAMTVTSSSFASGGAISEQYSCKGTDISPALTWSGAPAKTKSIAVIMDDPDAPAGTWVHWVMWNVPASKHSLAESVAKNEQLDDGSQQGRNSFGKIGYNGPCPPMGQTHRYFFRVYALDSKLTLTSATDRAALDEAMKGHVLAEGEYMGTFHK